MLLAKKKKKKKKKKKRDLYIGRYTRTCVQSTWRRARSEFVGFAVFTRPCKSQVE